MLCMDLAHLQTSRSSYSSKEAHLFDSNEIVQASMRLAYDFESGSTEHSD